MEKTMNKTIREKIINYKYYLIQEIKMAEMTLAALKERHDAIEKDATMSAESKQNLLQCSTAQIEATTFGINERREELSEVIELL